MRPFIKFLARKILKIETETFKVCPSCSAGKAEYQNKLYKEWNTELRRAHPCPNCFKKPTWLGKVCSECQETLNLWCPCHIEPDYADKWSWKTRGPLADYIVSEYCNRCGLRIKELWKCEDDEEYDKLLEGKYKRDD